MSEVAKGNEGEILENSDGSEAIADLIRERYGKVSPQKASRILKESKPEDGHVAVLGLLAHYRGPYGEADRARLLEIVAEEPDSFEAQRNQRAIAAAVAEKLGGALEDEQLDQFVECVSSWGWRDGEELLVPLISLHGVPLPRQRFVKMLQLPGECRLKSELLRRHAGQFEVEDIDWVIAKEVENKARAAKSVENSWELLEVKMRYESDSNIRPYMEEAVERERIDLTEDYQRPSQKVLADLARFIPALQPRHFDSLVAEGNSVVHRELLLRHGGVLGETRRRAIFRKTSPAWILEAALKKRPADKELVEMLLDGVVENFGPIYDDESGTSSGHKFLAKAAKHLQPEHVKRLIERGHARFVFNYVARDYPEKLTASRRLLFSEHAEDIPAWWVQEQGGNFQPEEVKMLIESCLEGPMADKHYRGHSAGLFMFDRLSGLVAIMAEYHPDRLPEGFDKIGALLKHPRVVRDAAESVRQNGSEFKPEHIDTTLVTYTYKKEVMEILAWLIHYHPDKVSPRQYNAVKEYLSSDKVSFRERQLIRIAGAQLLQKIDGLVGKMLPEWTKADALACLVENHPGAITDDDLEALSGSPKRRIVRALIQRCVPRMDALGIDRLMDMIQKDDPVSPSTKEEEREGLMTDLVVFAGPYLLPRHRERIIEEDIWGPPSAKLLELYSPDLSEPNKDRIAQKFGHLYV